MKITTYIMYTVILLIPISSSAAENITECDIHAAHPSDPDHVGEGRGSREVVTHVAIPACREAVKQFPKEARFHYQLGRALIYWADANKADLTEGIGHLKHAAEMKYTQALFVLGLMYKRQGETCAAEPLTRLAAEQGLKSARLTYVNDVFGGIYKDCELSATRKEMAAYLEAVATQISGYYEGMLLTALNRELGSME